MRIEVLINDFDLKVYTIKQPKLKIGSGDDCDIVIKDSGISRNHLIILIEGESVFAIDPGSRNGTFLNENRLSIGQKVEFNSFFPLRLGDQVLLTLILGDSEDTAISEFNTNHISNTKYEGSEATRIIDLKTLNKPLSDELIKKRTRLRKKKIPPKKIVVTDSFRMRIIYALGLILLGLAWLNPFNEELLSEQGFEDQFVEKKSVVSVKKEDIKMSKLLDKKDLVAKEQILTFLDEPKCVSDIEKYLCQNIPGTDSQQWGAYQRGTVIHLLLDGTDFRSKALKMLIKTDVETIDLKDYEESLRILVAALVIDLFPATLELEQFKDLNVTISLFMKEEEVQRPFQSIAFKLSDLMEMKSVIGPDSLKKVPDYGIYQFLFLNEYLRIY